MLGPKLKLDRARQHIGELKRQAAAFGKRRPYRIVLEAADKPHMVKFTVRIRENIPKYLAPIVGDIVHNMRSALDQVACAIVPGGISDGVVQFPFTASADTLEATIQSRHIDRADAKAVDIIRQMKPYPGGNDTLNGIQLLDNTDKHRLLIPVIAHTGIADFTLKAGTSVVDFKNFGVIGVKDGQILVVSPMPGNMKLGDEINATFAVAFGEGPFENVPIIDWLNTVASHLDGVIDLFKPYVQ